MSKPDKQTEDAAKLEPEIVSAISSLSPPSTDNVRALRRSFSKRIAKAAPELIIELAVRLVDRTQFLSRFVAYELVLHHKQALLSLNTKRLERLGRGIDSWAAVDTFACYLAGPSWRQHQVSDIVIKRWARSRDRWWRRAALVSTVPLNNKARGGTGDTARTVMICAMLVADRDDMVVKALSWALRELSKRDPKSVRAFLKKHQSVLAPRVVREVSSKLKTGLKNPRRQRT